MYMFCMIMCMYMYSMHSTMLFDFPNCMYMYMYSIVNLVPDALFLLLSIRKVNSACEHAPSAVKD